MNICDFQRRLSLIYFYPRRIHRVACSSRRLGFGRENWVEVRLLEVVQVGPGFGTRKRIHCCGDTFSTIYKVLKEKKKILILIIRSEI